MGFHRPRMGLVVFNIAILLVDGKKRDIQSFGNTMRKLSLAVPRIFHLLQFRDVANHTDENLSSRSRHRTRTDFNGKHFACALSVQRAEQNPFTAGLPQLRINLLNSLQRPQIMHPQRLKIVRAVSISGNRRLVGITNRAVFGKDQNNIPRRIGDAAEERQFRRQIV